MLANDLIIYMLKVASEGIRCEFYCEDILLEDLKLCYNIRDIEDLIGEGIYCVYCDNDLIVTRELIVTRYYRILSREERGSWDL